jgi:para-nitrobenzyl esterase
MTRAWCLLVLSGVLAFVSGARGAGSQPKVKIDSGKIKGKLDGNTSVFLGIPYAAPPVGELRWKPPMPVARWSGVRDATKFGSRCMQGPVFSDMVFRDPGISEDCLTLNVWAPPKSGNRRLPVMVWIYGGGFVAGGSSEPRQDGTNLAKHGVVVVSLNYRLGIFGFFSHPDLITESGRNSAGNYGLLDQAAALEWVKRNIATFGGDPGNVTIFGESAGSFSVSAQMASPRAKGLFHKAVGESGAAFSATLPFKTLEVSSQDSAKFGTEVLGVKTLAELRAIPAQKLLDSTLKPEHGGAFRFTPNVDGYFLPQSVPAIFAAGQQNDVPLLAGWNRDEGGVLEKEKPTAASLKEYAVKQFGENAEEFLKLYPGDTDEQALRSMKDIAGDRFIALSTWRWMEAQKKTGKSPVYRYRFDQDHPPDPKRPPNSGAYHSAEIEYVFGQLDPETWVSWRSEDRALSEAMQKYWSGFARTGQPSGDGLPAWPAYDSSDRWTVMHLDAQIKAEPDTLRDRYLFLDRVWTK